ncbi:MAG TPA: ABC transporter ATP-binding protein [Fulvivirga sp.]|nr:ABC transporter ATP-binding protein [Fulvivirga sp.]
MQVKLEKLTKRFNRELIFKDLNFTFESGKRYAIIGPNGSGKSTLLQIIAGYALPSSGAVIYNAGSNSIEPEEIFSHVTIAAPYLEIIEEYTLVEQLEFHFKFKKIRPNYTIDSVIKAAAFEGVEHKFIKNFSSGMKQRLKLAMAFYSESDILLLDEPTSNLDQQGVTWYQEHLANINDRLIIIASNQEYEYITATEHLNIMHYKQS